MYPLLFSLVLRRLPAETAHRIAFGAIRLAAAVPGLARLLRRWLVPNDPVLRVRVWDLDLPGPLGLAAGFDKDALGCDALGMLGFGHVEAGTVTGRAQPGNQKPRLFRLPADRALVNRMGFNNRGSAAAATRLAGRRHPTTAVGVNIGRTKAVPDDQVIADYVASARRLAPLAGYLVVNVSSPNTPGLRDLQATERLRPLLMAVRDALEAASPHRRVPLLVKVAPDLTDADVDAVADLAVELDLDGIVATNTTVGRDGLHTEPTLVAEVGAGGLSGAPLRPRALAVLRRLRARVPDRCVLVAVGGVETADDAWERIRAGATLVQGYAGFVYGGPLWPRRVQRGLAGHVRAAGLSSLADAVGTEPTGRTAGNPPR